MASPQRYRSSTNPGQRPTGPARAERGIGPKGIYAQAPPLSCTWGSLGWFRVKGESSSRCTGHAVPAERTISHTPCSIAPCTQIDGTGGNRLAGVLVLFFLRVALQPEQNQPVDQFGIRHSAGCPQLGIHAD